MTLDRNRHRWPSSPPPGRGPSAKAAQRELRQAWKDLRADLHRGAANRDGWFHRAPPDSFVEVRPDRDQAVRPIHRSAIREETSPGSRRILGRNWPGWCWYKRRSSPPWRWESGRVRYRGWLLSWRPVGYSPHRHLYGGGSLPPVPETVARDPRQC